jgi:thioredoxin 1
MENEVNKDNYQELVVENPVPTVVDFWGPQCARCFQLMPSIEAIAEEKKGQMRLIKIDASKNRRLCMGLRLMSLPAFLFYRDGREVGRLSGDGVTEKELHEAVDRLLASREIS